MPTYDYMCDSCGIAFEVQHKMTDTPVIVCPKCGQTARQVLSAGFGLNFTGKGFYQTDTQKPAHSVSTSAAKSEAEPAAAGKTESSAHSCSSSCSCSGCGCSS